MSVQAGRWTFMSTPSLEAAMSPRDVLRNRRTYPVTASCLHPDCGNSCTYPVDSRGRRPLFCSPRCAQKYAHQRKELSNEIAVVERAIDQAGPRSALGEALRKQLAHARWHLARYGGSDS